MSELFVALTPANLLACLAGSVLGTLVGVLPGLGPAGAMALVLPLTIKLDPTAGLIMLAGIYYGAMYGGSTTSILVNVPGEAASVVTTIDGYRLARRGRAGAALAVAALASFVAGTFSVIALQLAAPAVARLALAFGPAEYFAFTLLGLVVLSNLSGGLAAEGAGHDRGGAHALDRRHGPARRRRALHLRRGRRPGRPQLRRGDHRALRRGRGARRRRGRPGADGRGDARPLPRALPESCRAAPGRAAHAPGHRARLRHRAHPRAVRDHRLVRLLRRGASRLPLTGTSWGRGRSKAWPAPRRPTMPPPGAG